MNSMFGCAPVSPDFENMIMPPSMDREYLLKTAEIIEPNPMA